LRSGKWTSKGQYTETYETYFGKAEVKRYVYQSSEGGKTYCPLEEKAPLIEGATPGGGSDRRTLHCQHLVSARPRRPVGSLLNVVDRVFDLGLVLVETSFEIYMGCPSHNALNSDQPPCAASDMPNICNSNISGRCRFHNFCQARKESITILHHIHSVLNRDGTVAVDVIGGATVPFLHYAEPIDQRRIVLAQVEKHTKPTLALTSLSECGEGPSHRAAKACNEIPTPHLQSSRLKIDAVTNH
jgi:hypothetical protein